MEKSQTNAELLKKWLKFQQLASLNNWKEGEAAHSYEAEVSRISENFQMCRVWWSFQLWRWNFEDHKAAGLANKFVKSITVYFGLVLKSTIQSHNLRDSLSELDRPQSLYYSFLRKSESYCQAGLVSQNTNKFKPGALKLELPFCQDNSIFRLNSPALLLAMFHNIS